MDGPPGRRSSSGSRRRLSGGGSLGLTPARSRRSSKRQVDEETSTCANRHDEAVRQLAAIRDATGMEPKRYFDGKGFGKAIVLVHRAGMGETHSGLDSLAIQAPCLAEQIKVVRGPRGIA
jgi:hypothetical protein